MTDIDTTPKRDADERDPRRPRCADFDEDCFGLNHLKCYLHDPAKGVCPFLSKDVS